MHVKFVNVITMHPYALMMQIRDMVSAMIVIIIQLEIFVTNASQATTGILLYLRKTKMLVNVSCIES